MPTQVMPLTCHHEADQHADKKDIGGFSQKRSADMQSSAAEERPMLVSVASTHHYIRICLRSKAQTIGETWCCL